MTSEKVYVFDLDGVVYNSRAHPLEKQAVALVGRRTEELLGWPVGRFDELLAGDGMTPIRLGKVLCDEYGLGAYQHLDDYHLRLDYSPLQPCEETRAGLSRLKGRRLIYTDGTRAHAASVLERLGIADMFEEVHDIHVFSSPKQLVDFKRYLAHIAAPAGEVTFVEDKELNLLSAKQAGVRTVWIGDGEMPAHVDESAAELKTWLQKETAGGDA